MLLPLREVADEQRERDCGQKILQWKQHVAESSKEWITKVNTHSPSTSFCRTVSDRDCAAVLD